jgi:NADH:ubiquinone oxidoreductase subunit 6 (subunit J)
MGAVVVIAFIGLLGYMILSTPWLVLSNAEPSDTTRAIGRLLLMDYLLPFEAVSLLLLGALIGATTLSRKDT